MKNSSVLNVRDKYQSATDSAQSQEAVEVEAKTILFEDRKYLTFLFLLVPFVCALWPCLRGAKLCSKRQQVLL